MEFTNDEIFEMELRNFLFLNFKVFKRINFEKGLIFEFRNYDRPVFVLKKLCLVLHGAAILARKLLRTQLIILFPLYNVGIVCKILLFIDYVVGNSMYWNCTWYYPHEVF